jgi:hypothetical protein
MPAWNDRRLARQNEEQGLMRRAGTNSINQSSQARSGETDDDAPSKHNISCKANRRRQQVAI